MTGPAPDSAVERDATVVGGPANTGSERAVVFSFDEEFAFHAQVALVSLLLNTASRAFCVHLLTDALTDERRLEFDAIGRTFGTAITIHLIDYAPVRDLPQPFWQGAASYARWLAPELLCEEVLLYLDSDLIVQADVEELFRCYEPGGLIGGVEGTRGASQRRQALGLADDEPYLNAGVMLINRSAWVAEQITSKSIEFAANFTGKLWGADQDALNVVARGRKYLIAAKWNIGTYTIGYYGLGKQFGVDTFDGIIHFSGEIKPWMKWADPWSKRIYGKYAALLRPSGALLQEPSTLQHQLYQARAFDEEDDVAGANETRRGIIDFLLKHVDRKLLRHKF